MLNKIVRLGVVGLNHGLTHVNNIIKLKSEAKLVAICANNVNQERSKIATTLGCELYSDFRAMLDTCTLDGIVVCTPNNLRLEIIESCAKKNIAVLIEKPLAETMEEAEKIITLVEHKKIKALVGHHRRFSIKLNFLKNLLANKEIGTVLGFSAIWAIKKPDGYYLDKDGLFNWKTRKEEGGGPLLINAIHEIDNFRYLFGEISKINSIKNSMIRNHQVEDTAVVSIAFQNGIVGNIFISDATPSPFCYEATVRENTIYPSYQENCYYIFGSEGTISFPNFMKFYYSCENKVGWQYHLDHKRFQIDENSEKDPLMIELKHFCRVIREEEKPLVTVYDAAKTLKNILDIRL
jgi:predicted dehydrogenase